ncbi:thiamine pyrophosphate TPP-binding domain-containing protein [Natrinema pellirubrum DSM 15624]|uniref:Thiamine pyrophosphate TPP-binding domain-containing protein n=1 Tax=Natrinema pellirubrum (strain DSM 15624 / CIP 106293 / JCM 10476 / NCIMB 786 / 157) TaxID=797303 RepID=L0JKX9_NATP1|nr:thiamine pyrophosphate-binding protein [Natrinema pellirubrum]AGB31919.1 thiamine pyrophosphate-dependent enzyme, possible carboligase or decarboxylase [Natrinema pellirubrum DSM 15624]ELY77736.1 thiamine pyrophosphate TPP-binding domain-containing protein [Natrinema pellirubrum DSM 15624]
MTDEYTGADLFTDALETYGVDYVFGNPGTTELPIMDAIGDSDLEYRLGLHEDIAVGMAGGYAQRRRYHAHHDDSITPVGVANLHIAPGLAHGLGNLYAAKITGAPLVVTAGNHSTDFRHEEPILSGRLADMAREYCKWSDEVLDVDALPTMLRRAFRVAMTPPTGPVFLGLPLDVMLAETDAEPERLGPIPNAGGGDPGQLERAAELLAEADDPVIVVGDHVARSGADAVAAAVDLAEATGARVHGEILACEVDFPTDHEQWVSYLPTNEELAAMLMDTDTVLFAGCSTNTTLTRHEEALVDPDTTCIHLSDDSWQVGKNQPADAAVIGDPGLVMQGIAERVQTKLSEDVVADRLEGVAEVKEMVESQMAGYGEADGDDPRASKAQLVDAMERVAGDAAIVDEGVTSKYAMLTRWDLGPEQYISNKGGGLGYGLPAAVGAAVAEEQHDEPRDVVGFIGDGSYQYYPHSIYSAARYDLDLTVVISDNRNYRILKDNTLAIMGGEEDDYDFVGMDFEPNVDLVKNAESHGARAELVETPDGIEGALEAALDRAGPDVLDVLVQD